MRIAFLGLGLIGGSVARAVRERGGDDGTRITAWTPSGRGPASALAAGIVDAAAPDLRTAVRDADLVVVAAPPLATLGIVDALAALPASVLSPTATVTDVASTKSAIVARADASGVRFVGGHPMAGREVAGFGSSVADLFAGRPWAVVRGAHAEDADVARVVGLARACGAVPVLMTADAHDAAVAAISHAPLVLAAALVEAVAGAPGAPTPAGTDSARMLAATGWRGMTRLAKGDPEMGAGILATNAPAVARRLRDVRDRLDAWIEALDALGALDGADETTHAALRAALEADRRRAVAWDEEQA